MIRVADTHAILWFFEGDRRLSARARGAISDPSGLVVVPTIVLAEIWYLCQRRRAASLFEGILNELSRIQNVEFAPFDIALFPMMPAGFEMHDAIIVATGRYWAARTAEGVAIVTKDADISKRSGLSVIW